MEKHFLTVLHEREVMDEMSLDLLKGGMYSCGCGSLTSCSCYKAGHQSCGNRNQVQDTIIVAKPDTIPPKPIKP